MLNEVKHLAVESMKLHSAALRCFPPVSMTECFRWNPRFFLRPLNALVSWRRRNASNDRMEIIESPLCRGRPMCLSALKSSGRSRASMWSSSLRCVALDRQCGRAPHTGAGLGTAPTQRCSLISLMPQCDHRCYDGCLCITNAGDRTSSPLN